MKSTFALSAIVAAVAVFSQAAVAQTASSPTRAEVKSEAKKGSLAPAGEAAGNNAQKAEAGKASTTTRSDRKATTQADAKAGKIQPAGEAAQPAGETPKK